MLYHTEKLINIFETSALTEGDAADIARAFKIGSAGRTYDATKGDLGVLLGRLAGVSVYRNDQTLALVGDDNPARFVDCDVYDGAAVEMHDGSWAVVGHGDRFWHPTTPVTAANEGAARDALTAPYNAGAGSWS